MDFYPKVLKRQGIKDRWLEKGRHHEKEKETIPGGDEAAIAV